MSIYGGRKRWKDFSDLYHRVAGSAPPEEVDVEPADRGADWATLRKAQPADYILPATRAWLATLPDDVQPVALVERYPRVVNLIALNWNDKRECPAVFDDLLFDRRGGRAGFPASSQRDLLNLQEYWYNGHPVRPDQ